MNILFPDLITYEHVSDKARLTQVARDLGVPVPSQIVIHEPGAVRATGLRDAAGGELGWPLVAKPARSAVRRAGGVQKLGVRHVPTAEQLPVALASYPPEAYPILLQERIVGPGMGVFLLGDERGRLIASFAHRRIREKPPTGGVSVYCESVPLREDVREHAERIMSHFGWRGVLMLEFKEDASTGTPYLMEANGRFWGSLQLAIDAGVDFPKLLVDSTLGVELEPVRAYRTGVRSRWLWGDVDHLLWILRAPRGYRSLHASLPGRLQALGRFLVPWRPGERSDVLRIDDPRPFLRESVQWLADVLG
jgi:predicted ATP-grasp superfamily ATP-dependent carboligase